MPFDLSIRTYLRDYQEEYEAAIHDGEHTPELSFRVPLDRMLRQISIDLSANTNISVVLEPRNQGRMGRPDWRIHDRVSLGVFGYVEAKGLSVDQIDITPYQNQIDRYLTLGHKLIITDGLDFVFCFSDTTEVVPLIDKNRMGDFGWERLPINPRFRYYMERFFSNPTPQYVDEEKLVELVAVRTRILADEINRFAELPIEEAINQEESEIIDFLGGLRSLLYNHNDPSFRTGKIFSDFMAQVIMFCLLYAHQVVCSDNDSPTEKEQKIRHYAFDDAVDDYVLLPFRNLMAYLRDHAEAGSFIGQWVNECISFLSFVRMGEHRLMNPDYHRLFELFLNKFDKRMRFDYGAFYTPKILADFVVRFVNKAVENCFNGLSIYDNGNTIIDPCCGTGSFLEQIVAKDCSDGAYNLCGFEILPAPYMLANYRMSLVRQRYMRRNLNSSIILANSLSNFLLQDNADAHSIEGRELIRAKELSSRPLTLIIGNPPSSDSKRNNDSAEFSQINELMEDFRPPRASRHGRQNIQKQINNPFMQFLRWSCEKLLTSSNHTVLAFVVPLSFLEAESYKYARKYLVEHFSNIWAVAIDTDARTGVRGDSLFMTMQGRAVIVLTKTYGENTPIKEINFVDISHAKREDKEATLSGRIEEFFDRFTNFAINNATYSFIPTHPFNEELYASFWPISGESQNTGIFINQCSGAKMAPTGLLTHVNPFMLKRRSKDIAARGITAAREWVGDQDKPIVDGKIIAFQNALCTVNTRDLNGILNDKICRYSYRPFVSSNALLWQTVFDFQVGVEGGGARIRPEIRAVYDLPDTVGFALAHAPKDLSESLGQFTSFCWYFPDCDLCKRGNSHIYLNQYIRDTNTNEVVNNIHSFVLNHLNNMLGISSSESAKKMVFYAYAIFCSQVYLEEFYGALYVVNQSDNRARIPVVDNAEAFLRITHLGERLADLEKSDCTVNNVLRFDYDQLLDQIGQNDFLLEHSRSSARSPYDEENEQLILRDVSSEREIRVDCPIPLQKFTVAGYNVIKDCWLKFHSYRYTHCNFTRNDFRELLDLLNKITSQMQIVSEIDEIVHDIIDGRLPILNYANT